MWPLRVDSQLEQEKARSRSLTERMVSLEAGERHATRVLEEVREQLEKERCGHLRHVRATEAQSERQRRMVQQKSEEIASLLAGAAGSGEESEPHLIRDGSAVQSLLLVIADLRKEAERAQGEAQCIICFDAAPNAVFLPCKHSGACMGCARQMTSCPLCRAPLTECMEVFT